MNPGDVMISRSSTTTVEEFEQYRYRNSRCTNRLNVCSRHCQDRHCLREQMTACRKCGCEQCYRDYRRAEHDYMRLEREVYQTRYQEIRYENNPIFEQYYPAQFNNVKQLKSGDEMNLVEKVKNLKLSQADKLLRKHGVVDAEGDLTEVGQDLVWAKLLDQFKDEIVTDLKAIDKDAKASK